MSAQALGTGAAFPGRSASRSLRTGSESLPREERAGLLEAQTSQRSSNKMSFLIKLCTFLY